MRGRERDLARVSASDVMSLTSVSDILSLSLVRAPLLEQRRALQGLFDFIRSPYQIDYAYSELFSNLLCFKQFCKAKRPGVRRCRRHACPSLSYAGPIKTDSI